MTRSRQIRLPAEPDVHTTTLYARTSSGQTVARWRYEHYQMSEGWLCYEGVEPNPNAPYAGVLGCLDLWHEVVAGCVRHEWTLFAQPVSDPSVHHDKTK